MQNYAQHISNIQQGMRGRGVSPFSPQLVRSFCMIALLSFLTGCKMDLSDQMIKEMDSVFQAYETAAGSSRRARDERMEAIKREHKENSTPLTTDIEYATKARKQAEKNKNEEAEADKEMKKAVSRVVQKYFPPGMKMEEAFKLLHLLKDQGFGIHENRFEGTRSWPDGELKPYREEAATKQKRLALDPTGLMVNYTASKSERQMIIFGKRTYIAIYTDGNKIISSEGNIIPELHVP